MLAEEGSPSHSVVADMLSNTPHQHMQTSSVNQKKKIGH